MKLPLEKELALVAQQAELDNCHSRDALLALAIDLAKLAKTRQAALSAESKDEAVAAAIAHHTAESTSDYWAISLQSLPIDQLREECKRVLRMSHEAEQMLRDYFRTPN